MAAIDFANGTVILTNWLNDVDAVVWDIFGGATTAALARVALGLPSGWPGVINQYLKSDGTDAVWGNMLVAMNLGGTQVLTTTHLNRLLVAGTNGATYTLPDLTAAMAGAVVAFSNNSSAGTTFTIAPDASDSILGSSGAGNIVLDGGGSVLLGASFENNRWYVFGFNKTASQAEMEAGTEATLRAMSPLHVAQAI